MRETMADGSTETWAAFLERTLGVRREPYERLRAEYDEYAKEPKPHAEPNPTCWGCDGSFGECGFARIEAKMRAEREPARWERLRRRWAGKHGNPETVSGQVNGVTPTG